VKFRTVAGGFQGIHASAELPRVPAPVGIDDRTILCVEDNPANLQLLEALIEGIPGTRMISAQTGELGIDLAQLHRPDLVLMDLNLPGIDGIETLKLLELSSQTQHIPVIALTARASKEDVAAGLAAGFEYYIAKPIDLSEISGAINELLRRS
jgi:CheY-like chemotaxis protein